MTEADWLECNNSLEMVDYLYGLKQGSPRKLRLFAIASCRRLVHMLPDQQEFLDVLDVAERHAEGRISKERLVSLTGNADQKRTECQSAALSAALAWSSSHDASDAFDLAVNRVRCSIWASSTTERQSGDNPHYFALVAASDAQDAVGAFALADGGETVDDPLESVYEPARMEALRQQAVLFREIMGNPFRPVTVDPCWLSPIVVPLAHSIYEKRAFQCLPILADALEDAACTNTDILNHSRQPGEHVRGCWVMDLLLGNK